jgi:DNA-binding MarR family transcriptional regulator
MNDYSTPRTETRYRGALVPDENGRLYDERFRAMMAAESSGDLYLPAVEAIVALRAAGKFMHLNFERWAEKHQLSEGRLQVIFALKRAPGHQLPLGELADSLEVTPRNITGLVDHLERAQLVQRVPDPEDRRSVLARLTPAGLAKVKEVWQEAFTQRHIVTEGLTADELAQLRHLCFKLVNNMCGAHSSAAQEVTL